MVTQLSYAQRFSLLRPFSEQIFTWIKKEIKLETQAKGSILRKNLGSACLSPAFKELSCAIIDCIIAGEEELGEWIASLWIHKKSALFSLFHKHLEQVSKEYQTLTSLPVDAENALLQDSVQTFGARNSYIFSVLNSVVLSSEALQRLQKEAEVEV